MKQNNHLSLPSFFDQQKLTSTLISKPGNFVKPTSHSSYASQNLSIICQGYDDPNIGSQIMSILLPSLKYYVRQFLPSDPFVNHRQRLANLILSCSEELDEGNSIGSCSFTIIYKFKNRIHCLRNEGLGVYFMDQRSKKIIPISNSPLIPFSLKKNHRKVGYFRKNMQIIPSILFQSEKNLHYQEIWLKNQGKIILGSIECFCLFSSEQIFSYFHGDKSDEEKAQQFMQEVKKRWRTIYQKDLTLICMNI